MFKTSESKLADFIALGELKIVKAHPKNHILECESQVDERPCPHCGLMTKTRYDKRVVKLKDVPLRFDSPPVTVILTKSRFQCSPCGKIFTEVIGGIKKYQRSTERFKRLIMWACERFSSLKQVRDDFKVSSDYVYRAHYEQLELRRRMNNNYQWPKLVGIDEHGFGKDKVTHRKAFVSMIVNHSQKKLMEVAFGKSKSILDAQLAHISGRENVRYVSMDMCDPYRRWVKDFFPNAQIVADKFHVIKLLSPAIMRERKRITSTNADKRARGLLLCNSKRLNYFDRQSLLKFIVNFPKLNELYHAKEALQNFYRIKGFQRASKAIKLMIQRFKNSTYSEVQRLGRTLENWSVEILNYFKTGLTNARLEGFNNKASIVRKRAYGYKNANNYRLQILNACS